VAGLAGGAGRMADRARALAGDNTDDLSLRLAGHLVELASLAEPSDPEIHRARAEVFERRVAAEASTMSKGVFAWAAAESRQKTG